MKPFSGYHFFHGAGKIAPADAYYRAQRGMSIYTDEKAPSRRAFMLNLQNDPENGPLDPLFRELCRKYGPVSNTTKGLSLDGPKYRAHQWDLNDEQIAEALSLLDTFYRETPASRN